MKWEVTGADRESGEEKVVVIDADTGFDAERVAGEQGVLVSDVRPAVDPGAPPAAAKKPAGPSFTPHVVIGLILALVLISIGSWRMGKPLIGPLSSDPSAAAGEVVGWLIGFTALGLLLAYFSSAIVWTCNPRTRAAGITQWKTLGKFAVVLVFGFVVIYLFFRQFFAD